MDILLTILAVLLSVCNFISAEGSNKKVFCYYSSSANGRPSVGKFWPEHIDAFLCTHIIFAFVDITKDGKDLKPNNWNDLGPEGLYARTIRLKEKNPDLKVLLAVGGWKIGSKPFLPMIKDESTWTVWVKNAVKYLRKYGFDGMDMDWEFPGTRGSGEEDKYKFTKYMKCIYDSFTEEAEASGKERMILTLATASSEFYISKSYEPDQIYKYIDYMLLMTYNYHGSGWEKFTGHHSPLLPHPSDPEGEQQELHQQWSISYWLRTGVPKEKLIVGLPTYGLGFKLLDSANHGIRQAADGGNTKGRYTEESGILSLYEICEKIQDEGWKVEWIDEQKVPYCHGGGEWVGFESPDSIAIKAKNILMRDLAGAFIWSVEMDDFSGHCGGAKYPLLRTVSDILKNGLDAFKVGAAASVDVEPEGELDCNKVGLGIYKDHESCSHFNLCVPADHDSLRALRMVCPDGTLFDDQLKVFSNDEDWDGCNELGIYEDYDSCDHFKLCVSSNGGGLIGIRMRCPEGTQFDKELKVCNHHDNVSC